MYRPNQRFAIVASVLRFAANGLRYWPILCVGLLIFLPSGPHLLWSWEYYETGSYRTYVRCSYLGARGVAGPFYIDNCPAIAWLEYGKGAG